MKKSLIALSIATGMVGVAQAENTTTLYGAIGFDTKVSDMFDDSNKTVLDLHTAAARIGVKGTEDLSNGLQAFYNFEFNLEGDTLGDNEIRYANMGLKGNFGTLTLGKQKTVYATVVDNGVNNFNTGDEWYMYDAITASRLPKVISYVSPSFGGFQFAISGLFDGSDKSSTSVDAYEAGMWYDNTGFYAGAAYQFYKDDSMSGDNNEAVGLALGYGNDQYHVGFNASHIASESTDYALSADYYYGANTFRIGVGYEEANKENPRAANTWGLGLGYQYNFSKRTYAWVEGSYLKADLPQGYDGDDDDYTVTVGIRHNF